MNTSIKVILCLIVLLSSYNTMKIEASLNNEIDQPIARYGHKMVYNSYSNEIILFGGSKDNQNNPESYLPDGNGGFTGLNVDVGESNIDYTTGVLNITWTSGNPPGDGVVITAFSIRNISH